MKTQSKFLIFLIFSLFTVSLSAQWSSDLRLTNNPGASYTSGNNARNITIIGSTIHVIWFDARFGDTELMYKRSTDNGINWEPVVRLTNNAGASENPTIASNGSTIHVVWQDLRDGNYEIYYKVSTNSGNNWSGDTRLTNNFASSTNPAIFISVNKVSIVWNDDRDGNNEIYFKHSIDGGYNWEPVIRITNNSNSSTNPSISGLSDNIYVTWQDNRDGNYEIYYNFSSNMGTSWGSDTRLTNDAASSKLPCISAEPMSPQSYVHVAWQDDRDGNNEIYYKRSTSSGSNWEPVQRLTNAAGNSIAPSIITSNHFIHLVWEDDRSGGIYGIYYNRSSNDGISWGSDLKLNSSTSLARNPTIYRNGSAIHVVWWDNRDNDYEIYYKQNPTGNVTAVVNNGNVFPEKFSLSQNYPNPFNPGTKIEFSIPKTGFTTLVIYDALGREIEKLVNSVLNPGTYIADWITANHNSGIYFCKLISGSFSETKKMILVK